MPSISRINKQLERVAEALDSITGNVSHFQGEALESFTLSIERLARAQKALIETQVVIFIEATESDLDLPVLPLFIEERGSDEEDPDEDEEDGEPFPGGFISRRGKLVLFDREPEPRCETCGPPGPKECVDRDPVWCPDGEPEPETE